VYISDSSGESFHEDIVIHTIKELLQINIHYDLKPLLY